MQKSLTISEPHTLGAAKAVERLKGFTGILRRDWGSFIAGEPEQEWKGNVLHYKIRGVRGGTIIGTVTTTDSASTVQAECDIPRLVVPWKLVESQIRSALKGALKGA